MGRSTSSIVFVAIFGAVLLTGSVFEICTNKYKDSTNLVPECRNRVSLRWAKQCNVTP